MKSVIVAALTVEILVGAIALHLIRPPVATAEVHTVPGRGSVTVSLHATRPRSVLFQSALKVGEDAKACPPADLEGITSVGPMTPICFKVTQRNPPSLRVREGAPTEGVVGRVAQMRLVPHEGKIELEVLNLSSRALEVDISLR